MGFISINPLKKGKVTLCTSCTEKRASVEVRFTSEIINHKLLYLCDDCSDLLTKATNQVLGLADEEEDDEDCICNACPFPRDSCPVHGEIRYSGDGGERDERLRSTD